jgi:hypothetical protein
MLRAGAMARTACRRTAWSKSSAWIAAVLIGLVTFAGGCVTARPHVTTKVIFQHDDVTAEAAVEWP